MRRACRLLATGPTTGLSTLPGLPTGQALYPFFITSGGLSSYCRDCRGPLTGSPAAPRSRRAVADRRAPRGGPACSAWSAAIASWATPARGWWPQCLGRPLARRSARPGWTRLRRVLLRWQAPQPPATDRACSVGGLDPLAFPRPLAFPAADGGATRLAHRIAAGQVPFGGPVGRKTRGRLAPSGWSGRAQWCASRD